MYRRNITGIIERGKTEPFLAAMRASAAYQQERGIRARTTVWGAMTGQTNGVVICADFNTLDDLERFTELSAEDSHFASLRRDVRSQMVFDGSDVSLLRLAYHSEGLISSEEATAPLHYMRVMTGHVQAGRTRDFVSSVSEALEYQKDRGVAAYTSVWSSITGQTNGVAVVGEFASLAELEKFDEMAANDRDFARLRASTRESMVFLTSHVDLMRNLL